MSLKNAILGEERRNVFLTRPISFNLLWPALTIATTHSYRGVKMAEGMNPEEVVTVEELLRSCLYEQEALRRLLVRKGLLTDQEILDELQAVRRDLEARRGR